MNNKGEQMNSWNDVENTQKEMVYSILLAASTKAVNEMVEVNTFGLAERAKILMDENKALMFALAELGYKFKINKNHKNLKL